MQKKHFIQFGIPFRMHQTIRGKSFSITITATAQIESTNWQFPWSMFSPSPKTKSFTETINWYEAPANASDVGFLLKPGESYRVFGALSEQSVKATGKDIAARVIEVFKDGSYKISDVTQNPTPYPDNHEQ